MSKTLRQPRKIVLELKALKGSLLMKSKNYLTPTS